MVYIVLISGVIVFIGIKGINFIRIKDGLKLLKSNEEISPFKALTTSLAASLGIGNIIGVAGAIIIGGAGSVFWMWISAIFGCSLKYAEGALGIKYRGPMNYIKKTKICILPYVFAIGGICASFCVGNMIQINSISNIVKIPKIATGIIVSLLCFLVISKGTKSIANTTSKIIPIVTLIYVFTSLFIIFINIENIPDAFGLIFTDAFKGKSIIGGTLYSTIKIGLSRGVFSNEAGMGTSAIAHSMPKNEKPHNEGIIASLDPLIDTLFLCTLTSLVILTTNVFSTNEINACLLSYGSIGILGDVTIYASIILFGFSTIIGWYFYGEQCYLYIFKHKKIYQFIFLLMIIIGSIFETKLIWEISDIANMMMAIPNIIAIIILLPEIKKISRE